MIAFDKLYTRFLDFHNNTYQNSLLGFDALPLGIGRDNSSEVLIQLCFGFRLLKHISFSTYQNNDSQSSLNSELASVKNVILSASISGSNRAVLEVMFCVSDKHDPKFLYEKQSKNGVPFTALPETLLMTLTDQNLTSFLKKISPAPSQQLGDFRSFTQRKIGSSELNPSFMWFNILDISILPLLAFKFRMHELCVAALSDNRMHSAMTSVNGEILMNTCVIQIVSKLEVSVCK